MSRIDNQPSLEEFCDARPSKDSFVQFSVKALSIGKARLMQGSSSSRFSTVCVIDSSSKRDLGISGRAFQIESALSESLLVQIYY